MFAHELDTHPVDSGDDGAVNALLLSQQVSALGGQHTFSDRVHAFHNIVQGLAFPQAQTHSAVSAQVSAAGQDEISYSAQTLKRQGVGTA